MEIIQNGFFLPIINQLRNHHVDITKALKLSQLDRYQIENEENYIPFDLFGKLYTSICLMEGKHELGKLILDQLYIKDIANSNYIDVLRRSRNLLECVLFAEKYDKILFSGESMKLDIHGATSMFSSSFDTFKESASCEFYELLSLSATIAVFRYFIGYNWDPIAIHVQSSHLPMNEVRLNNPQKVKIREKQRGTTLIFPTDCLFSDKRKMAQENSNSTFKNIDTTSKKIQCLLESYQSDVIPSMDHFADVFNISNRTLRRRLAEENSQFEKLVENWRFTKALKLLKDPKSSVAEISNRIGYSNPSNFVRAFKSWTNVTPSSYRDQMLVS